jgi:signal transduction histidine kinase
MEEDSRKILMIEDVPPVYHLVRRLLASSNMEVETAYSLAEGIDKASRQPYDAVLLDLGLPDSTGLETYAEFQHRFPNVPVIILTGQDDENMADEAVKMGAQEYLIKGSYLAQGPAVQRLLARSILSAIERFSIYMALLHERARMESRVIERTAELMHANTHLQSLAARLVSAQEDERRRISLELHDETGQSVTALRLSLALIQAELPAEMAELRQKVDEAIEMADSAMERLRTLAHNLHPPALERVGLDQTLRDYCQRVARQSGLCVEYRGADFDAIPRHCQISIYRIVQEALTNVVKHARADNVWVEINRDAETISLDVRDDGCGFTLPAGRFTTANTGLGLVGIQERIEAIGGTLQVITAAGHGTQITASVPLEEEL